MVCLDDIVLLLIKPVGDNDLIGIFLGVDCALLKADVNLGEGHGCGVGSQGFPETQMIGILHCADLLSLEILHRVNCFVCCHDTETLVRVSQQFIAAFFVDFLDLFHEVFIVYMYPDVLYVVEKAGHIKDSNVGQECDLGSGVLHDKRNVSVLAGLQKFSISAQDTVGIDLDPHFSVRHAFHFLREPLRVDLCDRILGARSSQRPGISHGIPVSHSLLSAPGKHEKNCCKHHYHS